MRHVAVKPKPRSSSGSGAPLAVAKHEPVPLARASDQDAAPAAGDIPADLGGLADAVPRNEPRSELGNPDSYEVYGKRYVVLDDYHGFRERGTASWYGTKFHGKRTSSGEAYNMFEMTAAHKTLPIPCYVRVTNLTNNLSVIVRVNDRGPFHDGRIIDVSYAAAKRLNLIAEGSAPVEIEALTPSEPPTPVLTARAATPTSEVSALPSLRPTGVSPIASADAAVTPAIAPSVSRPTAALPTTAASQHWLQAGLFNDPQNAMALNERLSNLGIFNVQTKTQPTERGLIHRVVIGPFTTAAALTAARERLTALQLPSIPVTE